MDRDSFKSQYEEEQRQKEEKIRTDHAAARFARNPEKALEAMQKDSVDHFSFNYQEVANYIMEQSSRGRDIEAGTAPTADGVPEPLKEDLENAEGYNSIRPSVPEYVSDYTEEALEAATDKENYGSVTNNGRKEFAYIGDLDMDMSQSDSGMPPTPGSTAQDDDI
jgi:hypothetical protein